jgi:protein TonB
MEPKALVYRNWDELVFENRNKEYGAYVIRKSYNNKVLLGLGVSVVILAMLLSLQKFLGGPITVIPTLPGFGHTVKLIEPPSLPRRDVQVKSVAQTHTPHADLPPLVTTQTVEEVPVSNDPPSISGTETGIEGGVVESTGVDAGVVEAPVIPDLQKEYTNPEVAPEYEGGMEAMMTFLQRKLHYPGVPRRMGIEGIVYVSFLVKGNGQVDDVKVVRGIHPDCDKEAIRVISMLPGWKGGKQGGYPVNVRMVLPIKFKLN